MDSSQYQKYPECLIKLKFSQHQDLLLQNELHATGVYIDPIASRQDSVFSAGGTGGANPATFHLLDQLTKEINCDCDPRDQQQHCSSFVVLGDSGFGKSLFGIKLCRQYWNHVDNCKAEACDNVWHRIPIFISLPQCKTMENLLEQYVDDDVFERRKLPRSLKYLLVLDSYDELPKYENIADLQTGGYAWSGHPGQFQDIKVVTLTRKQDFDTTVRRKLFSVSTIKNSTSASATHGHSEFFMCPFSSRDISTYVEQFVKKISNPEHSSGAKSMILKLQDSDSEELWGVDEYMGWFKILPDLFQLATTPLLLSMILMIMPSMLAELGPSATFNRDKDNNGITERLERIQTLCSTKTGIYDLFTQYWFKYQAAKIPKAISQRIRADKRESLLTQMFRIYSQNLAQRFLRNGTLEDTIPLKVTKDWTLLDAPSCPQLWGQSRGKLDPAKRKILEKVRNNCKRHFPIEVQQTREDQTENLKEIHKICEALLPNEDTKETDQEKWANLDRIRGGCLVQFSPDQKLCRFSHRSLVVYFASRYLFETLELAFQLYMSNNVDCINGTTSSLLIENCLEDPDILAELGARSAMHDEFSDLLLQVVHASKTLPSICIFSSNAITILNIGGRSLSGLDFADVQIPFANLNRAILGSTDFRGADLQGVSLVNSFIVEAQFQGANMRDVEFGKSPSITVSAQMHDSARNVSLHSCMRSEEECWLISSNATGVIEVCGIEDATWKTVLLNRPNVFDQLVVSSDGRLVISTFANEGKTEITLRAWTITDPELDLASITISTPAPAPAEDDPDADEGDEELIPKTKLAEHNKYVTVWHRSALSVFFLGDGMEFSCLLDNHELPCPQMMTTTECGWPCGPCLQIQHHADSCLVCVSNQGHLLLVILNIEGQALKTIDSSHHLRHLGMQGVACAQFCGFGELCLSLHNSTSGDNCLVRLRLGVGSDLTEETLEVLTSQTVVTVVDLAYEPTLQKLASVSEHSITLWDMSKRPAIGYVVEYNVTPVQRTLVLPPFGDHKLLAFGKCCSCLAMYRRGHVHNWKADGLPMANGRQMVSKLLAVRRGGEHVFAQLVCDNLKQSHSIRLQQVRNGKQLRGIELEDEQQNRKYWAMQFVDSRRLLVCYEDGQGGDKENGFFIQVVSAALREEVRKIHVRLPPCEGGVIRSALADCYLTTAPEVNGSSVVEGWLKVTRKTEGLPKIPFPLINGSTETFEWRYTFNLTELTLDLELLTTEMDGQRQDEKSKLTKQEFVLRDAFQQVFIEKHKLSVGLVHQNSKGDTQTIFNIFLWFEIEHCEYFSCYHSSSDNQDDHPILGLLLLANTETTCCIQIECKTGRDSSDSDNWTWKVLWTNGHCTTFTAVNADMSKAHLSTRHKTRSLLQQNEARVDLAATNFPYYSFASLFTEIPRCSLDGPLEKRTILSVDGTRFLISESSWTIFVVAKKRRGLIGDLFDLIYSHVFFIIEGVRNHRRFLIFADYVKDGVRLRPYCDAEDTIEMFQRFKEYSEECSDLHAKSFHVSKEHGLKFIRSIHKDKQRNFKYESMATMDSDTLSCTKWAIEKLKVIGRHCSFGDEWHNRICIFPSDLVFEPAQNPITQILKLLRNAPPNFVLGAAALIVLISSVLLIYVNSQFNV